jgi:hypothetical protein
MDIANKEKPKIESVYVSDIRNLSAEIFADIINSMQQCSPNRPACLPPGPEPDTMTNPNCLEIGDNLINLDKEILTAIIKNIAQPLVNENKKQNTIISVLSARVQSLEMQLSKLEQSKQEVK